MKSFINLLELISNLHHQSFISHAVSLSVERGRGNLLITTRGLVSRSRARSKERLSRSRRRRKGEFSLLNEFETNEKGRVDNKSLSLIFVSWKLKNAAWSISFWRAATTLQKKTNETSTGFRAPLHLYRTFLICGKVDLHGFYFLLKTYLTRNSEKISRIWRNFIL